MKLRNKKTGEIKPAEAMEDGIYLYDEITKQWYKYELDLLTECWEDYEEPKEYWYIAELCAGLQKKQDTDNGEDRFNKQIGNYFETKEEAEKAVEKLKAWKRLKDDGITYSLDEGDGTSYIIIHSKEEKGPVQKVLRVLEDLTLLFGGEE